MIVRDVTARRTLTQDEVKRAVDPGFDKQFIRMVDKVTMVFVPVVRAIAALNCCVVRLRLRLGLLLSAAMRCGSMSARTSVAWVLALVMLLLASGCSAAPPGPAPAAAAHQQTPEAPTLRLLIVGDSTAVGTGASSPAQSLAGHIGRDHPRLLIENRGRNGARFSDVLAQLTPTDRFDVVLILAGGNDVIRRTPHDELARAIDAALAQAAALAPAVIVMPAGNVGNARLLFAPLSGWMTQRSRELHALVRAAALRHGATQVDLFRERDQDPFVLQPELTAGDGLHPSDAGYRLWHAELLAQTDLGRLLAPAR